MTSPRSAARLRVPRVQGFVLPLLLVLLLALTALAHGALVLSRRHLEISSLSARILQAERAAEAGVAAAEAGWWASEGPVTPLAGEAVLAAGVGFRYRAVRLAPELVLVEATGQIESTGPVRVSRVYWSADPDARAEAADAAVATGHGIVREGGEVFSTSQQPDGTEPSGGPEATGDAGAELCGALASLPPLSTVASLPPPEEEGASPIPPLGLLDGAALRAREGPGVRILEFGPLGVDPGGSGVIVAEGDLRIPTGARVTGLLLVGGDLVLEPGAEVVGVVRVRGIVRLEEGSRVMGDRCVLREAIAGAPTLAVPIPLPGGSWLPFS